MSRASSTREFGPPATRFVAWGAITAAVAGAVSTWTTDGPVRLGGLEGPNNGWLVLVAAAFAAAWARSMLRGSWTGIVGVLGAALLMTWTAGANWRDSRDVLGAKPGYGLVLVLAAGIALAGTAVASGVEVAKRRRRG